MSEIIRPLAHNLGFDKFGQLTAIWNENGSECSRIVGDMRGRFCALCGREWEVTAESFLNQAYDSRLELWMHRSCLVGHTALKEARLLFENINEACSKVDKPRVWKWKRIPNEYFGDGGSPWYHVAFEGFKPWMKIGSRKQVYHMSFHDLTQAQIDLFVKATLDFNVTKGTDLGSTYIHAWDNAEICRNLEIFLGMLRLDLPAEPPAEPPASVPAC